jgi:hypothetical protein
MNKHGMSPRRYLTVGLLAALAAGSLAGCTLEAAEAVRLNEPVALQDAGGGLSRITLSELGAERLGLTTAQVDTGDGGGLTVPYSSLLYDASGQTWVYTNPSPLVFLREAVTVDRIDGDVVKLTAGPTGGTSIVVVGASELFGAELDVEE